MTQLFICSRWTAGVRLGLTILGFSLVASSPAEEPNSRTEISDGPSSANLSISPQPRILSFQTGDHPSLLLDTTKSDRNGIRFVALEENGGDQITHSFNQPGKWVERSPSEATFQVQNVSIETPLELTTTVKSRGDRLEIRCSLKNTSATSRTLALWAIASVPPKGWLLAPVSRGLENNRWISARIVSFWNSSPAAPPVQMGRDAVALDLSLWKDTPSLKLGTRANAGWVATVRPDLSTVLLVQTSYTIGDRFPDDDCNVTLWMGSDPEGSRYAEMEWLSPWQTIAPGEILEWNCQLKLLPFSNEAALSPDGLVEAVRAPALVKAKSTPHQVLWRLDANGSFRRDRFQRVTEWLDPDGKTLAQCPLWINAPRWTEPGPALLWNESTLVETIPENLPPWETAGRTWKVEFTPTNTKSPQILFQDGDQEAGLLVAMDDSKLSVFFWNSPLSKEQVSVPISLGEPQTLIVTVDLKQNRLNLELNGGTPVRKNLNLSGLTRPTARLAIGRNPQVPPTFSIPALKPFVGSFQSLEVLQVPWSANK